MAYSKWLNPKELVALTKEYKKIKGNRGTRTADTELEEYLEKQWPGYCVHQFRTENNRDCIVEEIATGKQFSSKKWLWDVLYIKDNGSNKIMGLALQWIQKNGLEKDFFQKPPKGLFDKWIIGH